jgi:hypothetical protein
VFNQFALAIYRIDKESCRCLCAFFVRASEEIGDDGKILESAVERVKSKSIATFIVPGAYRFVILYNNTL